MRLEPELRRLEPELELRPFQQVDALLEYRVLPDWLPLHRDSVIQDGPVNCHAIHQDAQQHAQHLSSNEHVSDELRDELYGYRRGGA
jgi:hypothetical protein